MRSIAIISSQAFSLVNFRGTLIQALVRHGLTVYALAPDYTPELSRRIADLGGTPVEYSLSRVGMSPIRDARDTLALRRLLKKLRPDATLTYFVKPVIYGSIAAWLAGVPYRAAMIEGLGFVFTSDGSPIAMKRRMLRFAVMQMYRCALRITHRVFFLNADDMRHFVDARLVSADRIVRLDGIGVDLDHFRGGPPTLQPVTFVLVARMLREKGVYDFVAAATHLHGEFPQARFILVGDTDSNPGSVSAGELARWAADGIVEWTGHVRDVRVWLEIATVFVLPSYREGLPRSTQEAMAMGRAVITTDAPGCRDTVIEGKNGFIIPARDPQALAEAMRLFVSDPVLAVSMGRESRKIAEQRFDVHRINLQIMQAIGLRPAEGKPVS